MSIKATADFLARHTERPVYYASSAGYNAHYEVDQDMQRVDIEVSDARERKDKNERDGLGLHPSGFDLFDFKTQVDDFLDPRQIEEIYEPEVSHFILSQTGGHRTFVFDHTLRASDPELRGQKNMRDPVTLVHNDYTSQSGFTCLAENLGDEAEALARQRFQIVNIWRPLTDPVEDYPLALADRRTLSAEQLVDTERRSENHIGEVQLAVHAAGQRWYYFPRMRPHEVLMFNTFDSIDGGRRPCSIHTAIHLADAPANARPRESIETRAFVFF